jgi:hypothetical protein
MPSDAPNFLGRGAGLKTDGLCGVHASGCENPVAVDSDPRNDADSNLGG